MRILIDLQGAQSGSRFRGIGRYSTLLAKAMIQAGHQHEFFLLLNGMMHESIAEIQADFEDIVPRERIMVWHAPGPTDWLSGDNAPQRAAAELIREAFIAYLAPDAVHVSCATDGFEDNTIFTIGSFGPRPATAITFYDVIPLVHSDVYLRSDPRYEAMYRGRLKQIGAADAFLAVSAHARSEAVTHLDVADAKAHNISADADPMFRPVRIQRWAIRALRSKLGLTGRFMLYCGATDARKNHLRLIAAYSMLPPALQARHQLVFVGRTPPAHIDKFERYARALGVSERRFIIAGTVSDDELLLLYNLCTLFVMPSWHEGFSLPILEAMRCGVPVIGANTTSVPEVMGDPTALFDPFSAHSIAAKIEDVLSSPVRLKELAHKGCERARAFSWERSALAALAAIEGLQRRPLKPFDPGVVDTLIARLGQALPSASHDAVLLDVARAIGRTFVQPGPRQFLVDISEMIRADAGTGIQRVVRNILGALIASPPPTFQILPIYAIHESGWYRYAKRYAKEVLARKDDFFDGEDTEVELRAGDIFLGLDLHHRTPPREMNIADRLRAVGGYSYFVVYDLLPVLMPQNFPEAMAQRHMEWLLGVAKSDGAICISRSVADELIAWLPGSGARQSKLKVGWFHLGSDLSDHVTAGPADRDDLLVGAMRQRPSFLMVGTLEPRKGHLQTLIGFDQLWDAGCDVNLVIVGKHGWNVELQTDLIRTHGELGKRLFWTESASDGLLKLIYDQASCLIAASEGEGFGLPLVEAAERGVDIIARDIPVFREVAAEYASFFRGDDGASIAAAVREWLASAKPARLARIANGHRITWHESKNQLLRNVIDGQWYRRGDSSVDVRLVGSDFRLLSAVGRRVGTSMHSTHRAGYLLFGHCLSLPPAHYIAELALTFTANGKYRAAVSASERADVLVLYEKADTPTGEAIIRLEFGVTGPSNEVEVRLEVDAEIGVIVRALGIRQTGQQQACGDRAKVLEQQPNSEVRQCARDSMPKKKKSTSST